VTPPAIAWIDVPRGEGRWAPPGELAIPLDDRGLLLGEGVFETVLVEDGEPQLLGEHLERWGEGAAMLGLAPPPGRERMEGLLAEAVARSGITTGALRLNWSGGSGGPGQRGLEASPPADGSPRERFWLQLTESQPCFHKVRVVVSRWERRNGGSRLSRCKTFAYGPQIQARREARLAGADDALLLGSHGNLSCGTAANLLVCMEGSWFTPPLSSGCLPGVMRARALSGGWLKTRHLPSHEWERWEGALLINSLGCRVVVECEGQGLGEMTPATAEELWRSLL